MEDYTISDEQITASSEWSNDKAAFQGRLHLQETIIKSGGWGAGVNDSNQWLQVDLISLYIKWLLLQRKEEMEITTNG